MSFVINYFWHLTIDIWKIVFQRCRFIMHDCKTMGNAWGCLIFALAFILLPLVDDGTIFSLQNVHLYCCSNLSVTWTGIRRIYFVDCFILRHCDLGIYVFFSDAKMTTTSSTLLSAPFSPTKHLSQAGTVTTPMIWLHVLQILTANLYHFFGALTWVQRGAFVAISTRSKAVNVFNCSYRTFILLQCLQLLGLGFDFLYENGARRMCCEKWERIECQKY